MGDERRKPNNQFDKKPHNLNRKWGGKPNNFERNSNNPKRQRAPFEKKMQIMRGKHLYFLP